MTYSREFTGWGDITLQDLLISYRKAKADCYYEKTFPVSVKFSEYENDLIENLERLKHKLSNNTFFDDPKYLGECRLFPKKLSLRPKKNSVQEVNTQNGHIYFSNVDKAFEKIKSENDLEPEFRVIGDFPVETHIVSALWINKIGCKFDALLQEDCYGARLKRIRNENKILQKKSDKIFHISAIGSFEPYIHPYREWRAGGLKAIRSELEQNRNIIAVSLDLKSYYHLIQPEEFASEELYKDFKIKLTNEEKLFNRQLAEFLQSWSNKAKEYITKNIKSTNSDKENINGGLVIGLTCSRIISNIFLNNWDQKIREKITPIYYGRYVDDMFIVLHDPGNIRSTVDFMNFLKVRLNANCEAAYFDQASKENHEFWFINQGLGIKKSRIQLQPQKQKLFLLEGQSGLDFVDSIEKEITDLSSEFRLMPDPDQLEKSTAAQVLSANNSRAEKADTLRRADGLIIQRLSWALQLMHANTLAKDLPKENWKKERHDFYTFAHNHILRPDKVFEHFQYISRLLGLCVSLSEWYEAEKIIKRVRSALAKILAEKKIIINGSEIDTNQNSGQFWREEVNKALDIMFDDAILKHYPLKGSSIKNKISAQFINNNIKDKEYDFDNCVQMIAEADLAYTPYKEYILNNKKYNNINAVESASITFESLKGFINFETLKDFIDNSTQYKKASYYPLIFPTRPLSPEEIFEQMSFSPDSIEKWADFTKVLRGVWVETFLPTGVSNKDKRDQSDSFPHYIELGYEQKDKVIVALSNIKLDDNDWNKMACGKSNLSLKRYKSIANLVNQTLALDPKPDYLIFPELSIPIEWVQSISSRLCRAGISLIAGTEYRHDKDYIISEACLVLKNNLLGFPASAKIWQPKLEPAVHEDKELTSKFGKQWNQPYLDGLKIFNPKPVYIHNGIHFGVMVCSELQNSKARIAFQGYIGPVLE